MTDGAQFVDLLDRHGIRFVSGVPCSFLAGPIAAVTADARMRYVPAANEGTALAAAVGAYLAGTPSALLIQNSGFGNIINPLTSLTLPYGIPLLVLMSMRGWPTAAAGEPQHRLMGQVPPAWLDSLGVTHLPLTAEGPPFAEVMARAAPLLAARETVFILVGKGAFAPVDREPAPPRLTGLTREQSVAAVVRQLDDELVISTTGFLSRALFAAGDRPENFYMQGSMGHAGALALGAALCRPDRRFAILDGDGALLMHMGSLATIGAFAPSNLIHIVFDNGVYESTGSQPLAAGVDFAGLSAACGYRTHYRAETVEELIEAIRTAKAASGPALIHIVGMPGGQAGDRASESMDLMELTARFREAVSTLPAQK